MIQGMTCDRDETQPPSESVDPISTARPLVFVSNQSLLEKMPSAPEDQVRSWGFPSVFTWTDRPNAHYPPHQHASLTTHLILAGALTITYPDDATPRKETFGPGGRVDVDARRRHEVWIGGEGCTRRRMDSLGSSLRITGSVQYHGPPHELLAPRPLEFYAARMLRVWFYHAAETCRGDLLQDTLIVRAKYLHVEHTPARVSMGESLDTIQSRCASYGHRQGIHHARAAIDHHIRTRDITAKPTGQEARDPRDLGGQAGSFQPDDLVPRMLALQVTWRKLRRQAPSVKVLQVHADIDLSRRDAVDAHACAFERDDDDTAVRLLFRGGVGVVALRGRLGHGGGGVFEGEEGRHAVGLEASHEVAWRGLGDGGRAQEAGTRHVDVETAVAVQHIVDELERVLFVGEIEGAADDLGGWVLRAEFGGESAVIIGRGGGACVDDGGAVGCEFGHDGFADRLGGPGDYTDEAILLRSVQHAAPCAKSVEPYEFAVRSVWREVLTF
nr:hypothetical protein CFP56_22329 [Quercus suber]